jgi:hypothetical protein
MNSFTRLFLFVVLCGVAWGQGSTAQINGTVKDTSGLAVPGAEVKLTQTATGLVRTGESSADGSYVIPNLPIGPYLVEVSKMGFNKYIQSGLVLQVDANPTIEAVLKVGSISEQITVQADAAMVETRSSGVGQVVDSQRVVELPLNGRNPTELIFLAGMANTAPGTGSISSVRNYPTILISVAGGIPNGVTYLLDGTNHNDSYNHLNLPLPFPDALQEFKVETSALPAQYGSHSAAAVNAVTRSGGNQFHGDLFEFFRNGDLNARNFFAPTRDTLKRNQFGGVLGGPILKDKLFFFVGYQGTLQRSEPTQAIAFVPTPAMLAGDFRTVAGLSCNAKAIVLPASAGFVDNQISPSLLNPAALTIQQRLPAATDGCGKVNYGLRTNSDEHLSLVRMDYQISDKHSIFGRSYVALLDQPTTYDGKNALTLNTDASHFRSASLTLGDTYLISTSMVNAFRIGANRVDAPKIPDNFGRWQDLGVNASSFLAPTVRLSVTGNGFAIGSGNSIVGLANTGPNYNIADDLSWVKGSHQFAFGANYQFESVNSKTGINATGLFTFSGATTGLSLADFLVGTASAWTQGNLGQYYDRQNNFALYAQDSWKIDKRLTMVYGVRWEPYLSTFAKYGWLTHFDQGLFNQNTHSTVFANAPAGLIFPGDSQWPSGNKIANNRWNLFEPRIGLVWDPTGSGRLTVRAAYGRFSDRLNLLAFTGFAQSPPYGNNITLNTVNLSNPWATYPGGVNPLPIALSPNQVFPSAGAYTSFPTDLRPTTLNQWNVSIQRQVGTDWLLAANYIGNNTTHLVTASQANPAVFLGTGPCTLNGAAVAACSTTANVNTRRQLNLQNPAQGKFFGSVGTLDDGGTGNYNGLFLSVQKRLSHNTSVLANYTWSHCLSDLWNAFPGNNGTSSVTPGDRHHEHGNCAGSDQRQVFNLSAVLQTPKFSQRSLRWLAGNWQISPIVKIKSSQFFTVTTGVDNALSGEGAQRPNLVDLNPYSANPGVSGWLNRAAFASPATGTYGDLGAFNLKGPGIFQFDLAVSRTFVLSERYALQLRGEAFNLPNTLNPAVPVSALNSSSFGQIQSDISGTSGLASGDQRILQLAMKFVF